MPLRNPTTSPPAVGPATTDFIFQDDDDEHTASQQQNVSLDESEQLVVLSPFRGVTMDRTPQQRRTLFREEGNRDSVEQEEEEDSDAHSVTSAVTDQYFDTEEQQPISTNVISSTTLHSTTSSDEDDRSLGALLRRPLLQTPGRDSFSVSTTSNTRRTVRFALSPTSSPRRRRQRGTFSDADAQETDPQLNTLNTANVLAYLLHCLVASITGGTALHFHLPTRWQLLQRYETLVTPAHWTYGLWGVIMALEAAFAVAQCLPAWRSRPVVQSGTRWYFVQTMLLHSLWTVLFRTKLFAASLVCVVTATVLLVALLGSQHTISSRGPSTWLEYILLRLPFYLHAGWMMVLSVDHAALLVRKVGFRADIFDHTNSTDDSFDDDYFVPPSTAPTTAEQLFAESYHDAHEFDTELSWQLAVDMVSLALLLVVALTALFGWHPVRWPQPEFVIPSVVLWSYVRFYVLLSVRFFVFLLNSPAHSLCFLLFSWVSLIASVNPVRPCLNSMGRWLSRPFKMLL